MEDQTLARQLSQLMVDRIPMSQDLIEQYNLCSKKVEQYLGKGRKFMLPAQFKVTDPMKPALVDLNPFLTSLKMIKQWDLGTVKFWELIKKERLDEILFQDNISGSE